MSTLACHDAPGPLALSEDGKMAPLSWAPERLCDPALLVGSRAASGLVLTVRDPDVPGGPQVVELKPVEEQQSYKQVWQVRTGDPLLKTHRIYNPRPPFNTLSSNLYAVGMEPVPGQEELSANEAVNWTLRRVDGPEPEDGLGDVWFEIVPSADDTVALAAASDNSHALSLTARQGSDPSHSQQWSFQPIQHCE